MATASPNQRASLLAGLRTGGVRSVSGAAIPHTAAPGGAFNVPRFSMSRYQDTDEDEVGGYLDAIPQMAKHIPLTAAVDGPRFASMQQPQVKQSQLNANSVPFSPAGFGGNVNAQSMQMQMMQMEILRLQALQAQQYQVELITQAQLQAQAQAQGRRASSFIPPATAGPMTTSFGAGMQPRRTEQTKNPLSASHSDDHVPMTAALGGRFGTRRSDSDGADFSGQPPATPNYGSTTIISGGTALGPATPVTASNPNGPSSNTATMSKSDSASSWRRSGVNNSVLRSATSPSVKITPPPSERVSPPLVASPVVSSPLAPKARPQPLRFSISPQPLPIVAFESEDDADDAASSGSASSSQARSETSPTTSSSSHGQPPLSPREEASRKLYEGLGKGRPVPTTNLAVPDTASAPLAAPTRSVSTPMRQPRGPPSGQEEFAPKNFATRIRRRAIDALKLNSTREVPVEAF